MKQFKIYLKFNKKLLANKVYHQASDIETKMDLKQIKMLLFQFRSTVARQFQTLFYIYLFYMDEACVSFQERV